MGSWQKTCPRCKATYSVYSPGSVTPPTEYLSWMETHDCWEEAGFMDQEGVR